MRGLSLGLTLGQQGASGGVVAPSAPTVSGALRLEHTLTGAVPVGISTSTYGWQTCDWNLGALGTWADDTATTLTLALSRRHLGKAVRFFYVVGATRYYSNPSIAPVAWFNSNSGLLNGTAIQGYQQDGLDLFRLSGNSNTDRLRYQFRSAANPAGGRIGVASTGFTTACGPCNDVLIKNQWVILKARNTTSAGLRYFSIEFRASGLVEQAATRNSINVILDSSSLGIRSVYNGAFDGAGQTLNTGAYVMGTGYTDYLFAVKIEDVLGLPTIFLKRSKVASVLPSTGITEGTVGDLAADYDWITPSTGVTLIDDFGKAPGAVTTTMANQLAPLSTGTQAGVFTGNDTGLTYDDLLFEGVWPAPFAVQSVDYSIPAGGIITLTYNCTYYGRIPATIKVGINADPALGGAVVAAPATGTITAGPSGGTVTITRDYPQATIEVLVGTSPQYTFEVTY